MRSVEYYGSTCVTDVSTKEKAMVLYSQSVSKSHLKFLLQLVYKDTSIEVLVRQLNDDGDDKTLQKSPTCRGNSFMKPEVNRDQVLWN